MLCLLFLVCLFSSAYSSQNCGGLLKSAEMRLRSPDYPKPVKPNILCDWIIQPVSGNICRLEAEFLTADLHDASLTIAGISLTGSLAGIRTFFFHNSTTVSFRSGKSASKGFDVILHQKVCDVFLTPCNSEMNSKEITITGPQSFKNDCNYTIMRFSHKMCQVQINFQKFYLEKSPNCQSSGLQIEDDVVCGNLEGHQRYHFVNGKLKIRFYTDQTKGKNTSTFLLKLSQIACSDISESIDRVEDFNVFNSSNEQFLNYNPYPSTNNYGSCCNRVHNERHFYLSSPGFPNNNRIDCTYTIQKYSPDIQYIKFSFRYFWVGERDFYNNCNDGFLQIDRNTFCGCQTGFTWITTFNFYDYSPYKYLRLYLNQNTINRLSGFVIEVTQYRTNNYPPLRYKQLIYSNLTDIFDSMNLSKPLNIKKLDVEELNLTHSHNLTNRKAKIQNFETFGGIIPDFHCLSWNIKDWVILLQQALWAQLYCPSNFSPATSKILSQTNSEFRNGSDCEEINSNAGRFQISENFEFNSEGIYCIRFKQISGYCTLELTTHNVDIPWSPGCILSNIYISGIGNLCPISNYKTVYTNMQRGFVDVKIGNDDTAKNVHLSFRQHLCQSTIL